MRESHLCFATFTYLFFREAKPHSHPKNLHDLIPGFGGLVACRVNCNGSKVSAAVKQVSESPRPDTGVWWTGSL